MANDDSDAIGADVGLDPFNLNPSSALHPERLVRTVPTAAQEVYPEVSSELLSPVSLTQAPRGATLQPIAAAPGQPVNLLPPNPVNLAKVDPNAAPVIEKGAIAPQVQLAQAGQEGLRPVSPSPGGAVRPGQGQGMFGSNLVVGPKYDPNANPYQQQRDLMKAEADRLMQRGNDPSRQFWFGKSAEEDRKRAAELYGQIGQTDDKLQAQKDLQTKADNAGVKTQNQTYTQTDQTIVEDLVRRMRGGEQGAADILAARGHTDLVKGFQSDMITSMETKLEQGAKIKTKLDSAGTDQQYNNIKKDLEDPKNPLYDKDFNIPKTLGEWETQRGKRDEDMRKGRVAVQRYRQMRADQTDYTIETNKDLHTAYAGKATYPTNEPMHNAKGVKNEGNATNGGQAPSGSHDLRGYGRTWDTFDEAARKETAEATEKAFPQTEREKHVGIARAIVMATTDPKTGKVMDDADTYKKINSQPNVQQAIAEALAAALRGGAGGANGQLMKIELVKRGVAQNIADKLTTELAGLKGLVTGKEGKYLTNLTQAQVRYVLDFLKDYNVKDISARMGPVAERAGMYGATANKLPLEPELRGPLEDRVNLGRDKMIEHMGKQFRVIGDDNSTFVGTGKSAAAVPGAVRTPVPATALPALYPELQTTGEPVIPPRAPGQPPPPAVSPGGGGPAAPVVQPSTPGAVAVPPAAAPPVRVIPGPTGGPAAGTRLPYNPRAGQYGGIAPAAPAPVVPAGAQNFTQATTDLNLNPQERALYQRHLGNLRGPGGVDNPDGSRSSLYATTVGLGDKTYVLPTVYDGKKVSVDEAVARAKAQGIDNFPSYASPEAAKARYDQMHGYMDKDTAAHLASRPVQSTPQQPGGPGTSVATLPPAVAAPQGTKPGGTFTNGVPSAGFPSHIANNSAARMIYGIAGQTAQNVTNGQPNSAAITNNSAVVALSSAQSESSFKSETTHDGGRGYGLFGHNGNRLAAMHQFSGTKPGEAIPINAQTAFYVREMSKAADADPFIARTLANPNASAEDLTRVQMRMEKPEGYKGPGTEEQGKNWTQRLANTRAAMGGAGVETAAVQPSMANAPYPNPKSPQEAQANYRAGIRQTPEEVAASAELRQKRLDQATQSAAHLAPAIGSAAGGVIGSAVPVVGSVAGGAAGGALGGGIEHYFTAPPEQQNPRGYTEAAGWGAAKGAATNVGGAGLVGSAMRVGGTAAVEGGKKWYETGDTGEAYDAAMKGGAEGAFGEAFGRGLGLGHQVWNMMHTPGKAQLIAVAHVLATQEAKIAGPSGKMIDNPTWLKAEADAKALHQDPDTLAYNYRETKAAEAAGKIPKSMEEAVTQRPGAVAEAKVGREQYDPIREEVAAGGKKVAPNVVRPGTFMNDPVALVGNHPDVPAKFMPDAVAARDIMNQKAGSWREIWDNQVKARAALLTKEREADLIQGPGREEAQKAYRALADQVRTQQQHIAERLLPPNQAKALMTRLTTADEAYRQAKLAGGKDIVQKIAKGGDDGREARAAFNKLVGNDPAAKAMMDAMVKLHDKSAQRATSIGVFGAAGAMLHFIPGIGTMAGTGLGAYRAFQLLQQHMLEKAAGKTATFDKMIQRHLSDKTKARYQRASSSLAGPALREGVKALDESSAAQ